MRLNKEISDIEFSPGCFTRGIYQKTFVSIVNILRQ